MVELIKNVAKAYNSLNHDVLVPFLDEKIVYESQNVLKPLNGKNDVLEYLKHKFTTIRNKKNNVYAELGFLDVAKQNPCIILSQGTKENKGGLILVKTENNLITRIDICTVIPHWTSAIRTNEYPC